MQASCCVLFIFVVHLCTLQMRTFLREWKQKNMYERLYELKIVMIMKYCRLGTINISAVTPSQSHAP